MGVLNRWHSQLIKAVTVIKYFYKNDTSSPGCVVVLFLLDVCIIHISLEMRKNFQVYHSVTKDLQILDQLDINPQYDTF